jgi:hypothetical protein
MPPAVTVKGYFCSVSLPTPMCYAYDNTMSVRDSQVEPVRAATSGVYLRRLGLFTAALVIAVIASAGTALAQKVSRTPSGLTLDEGQSAILEFKLNSPIICSGSPPDCNVTLQFNSSDPAVTVSPNPLVFDDLQWSATLELTVIVASDGVYSGDKAVTLSTVADSASVYYNGFAVNIPVTVHNTDPAASPGISNRTVSLAPDGNTSVNVLDNITGNPDISSLTIVISPTNGNARVSGSSIFYTSNAGFTGNDSLTYRVCSNLDANACSNAILSFIIAKPLTGAPDTGFAPSSTESNLLIAAVSGLLLLSAGVIRRRTPCR